MPDTPLPRRQFFAAVAAIAGLLLAAGCQPPDPNPGPRCRKCRWPLTRPSSIARRECDDCYRWHQVLPYGHRVVVVRGLHAGRAGKVIDYCDHSGRYTIDFVSRSVTGAPSRALVHRHDITTHNLSAHL